MESDIEYFDVPPVIPSPIKIKILKLLGAFLTITVLGIALSGFENPNNILIGEKLIKPLALTDVLKPAGEYENKMGNFPSGKLKGGPKRHKLADRI